MKLKNFLFSVIVVTLALALNVKLAKASTTMRELLAGCEKTLVAGDDFISQGYCMGLARGVADMMQINCAGGFKQIAADSNNHTTAALIQVFVNWARANPTRWEEPASIEMMLAFRKAFPCN